MSKPNYVDFRAVKNAVSMVQVLERYDLMSQLHRNGDSITGNCPIHGGDNKTAFRVSISKNCWNCFSRCQCGGNVLDFVAKKERVSLLRAAHLLIEWFNLQIESPEEEDQPPRNQNREARSEPKPDRAPKPAPAPTKTEDDAPGENKPLEFELKHLQAEHPYLTERGLSAETVQTFGLGFCPKGILNGRIAIPIHNGTGQLVAYAGRWPGDTDQEKYLFPKGFRKSLELFNLHRAVQESSDSPLIIVEGFFDCLKLWQHGVKRVVALMGSSLSVMQEELIRKHTDSQSQVIVMLDEDDAGRAGREEIARRLAPWLFVKIHVFEKTGTQPDQLSADEVAALFH